MPKKGAPRDEVRKFLRKIGRKGGKARARKYDTKTFRKWAKKSGAGRPPKSSEEAH